jgi:hypothetical protein
MLRIRLLGERIRLDRSRDEARIWAVLVGLIAWLFLAILACDGNASVAAYAGPIATVDALSPWLKAKPTFLTAVPLGFTCHFLPCSVSCRIPSRLGPHSPKALREFSLGIGR